MYECMYVCTLTYGYGAFDARLGSQQQLLEIVYVSHLYVCIYVYIYIYMFIHTLCIYTYICNVCMYICDVCMYVCM